MRTLKKSDLALIAPKPEPVVIAPAVVKIDGQEVEIEEVDLEDVETLIKEVVDIIDNEEEEKGKEEKRRTEEGE